MSGLSTANAAQGFMQGFNFMEQQQDRKIQRDRQAKADARADEEYEYRTGRREVVDGRQDIQWEQKQGEYKHKLAERYNSKVDELALALKQNPDYDWQNDPRFTAFAHAGPTLEGLMSGQVPMEDPRVGKLLQEIAPDLIEGSQSAADLEGVVGITRGRQPGTVIVAVKRKDGTVVPKTVHQSSLDDDPIREYPVDGFMQRGMAYAKVGEMFKDPAAVDSWLASRGKLPKATTDKNAGEYERLLAMRSKYKPNSEEYKALSARMRKLTHIDGDDKPHTLTMKDEMGAEYSVEKVGDSWRFVDPGMAPAKMREDAASYAQERIDDEAGTFSSDKSDFSQFGGSRDRAYDYYYNQRLNELATDNAKRMESSNAAMSGGLADGDPSSAPQPPQSNEAPAGALEALQQDPSLASQFEAKYGYLPDGFEPQTADSIQADVEAGLPEVPRPGGEFQWQTEEEVDQKATEENRERVEQSNRESAGMGTGLSGLDIASESKRTANMAQEAEINRNYVKFRKGAQQGVIRLSAEELQALIQSGKLSEEEAAKAQSMLADLQKRQQSAGLASA